MKEVTRRSIQECVLFSLVAAPMLAAAEIVTYMLMGLPADRPLALAASIFAGREALTDPDGATVAMVGALSHFVVAGTWGLLFGLFSARESQPIRKRFVDQTLLGVLFGALVWLVDFQLLGRAFWPWMVAEPILPQLLLHVFAFGVPVSLMYARAERRVPDLSLYGDEVTQS